MITVGVDPDSVRHGIALYRDGALVELMSLSLVEIRRWLDSQSWESEVVFVIEDVLSQNFVYKMEFRRGLTAAAREKIKQDRIRKVGRCQQAQHELMAELEDRGIQVRLIKPHRGNWAERKAEFERVTGWTGQSNPDTRSAAYFGFLGVQKQKKLRLGAGGSRD